MPLGSFWPAKILLATMQNFHAAEETLFSRHIFAANVLLQAGLHCHSQNGLFISSSLSVTLAGV